MQQHAPQGTFESGLTLLSSSRGERLVPASLRSSRWPNGRQLPDSRCSDERCVDERYKPSALRSSMRAQTDVTRDQWTYRLAVGVGIYSGCPYRTTRRVEDFCATSCFALRARYLPRRGMRCPLSRSRDHGASDAATSMLRFHARNQLACAGIICHNVRHEL